MSDGFLDLDGLRTGFFVVISEKSWLVMPRRPLVVGLYALITMLRSLRSHSSWGYSYWLLAVELYSMCYLLIAVVEQK